MIFDVNTNWALIDDSGTEVVEFTSYLEISGGKDRDIPTKPLEEGSFAAYNSIEMPGEFNVQGAIIGEDSEIQYALDTLRDMVNSTELLTLVTPDNEVDNLALLGFNFVRNDKQGRHILVADLRLREIKEVKLHQTTAKINKMSTAQTKDASCVSNTDTGKVQPKEPQNSFLADLFD